MFEAVEGLIAEHEELEPRLADPAIHSDPALSKRLNQRYSELSSIIRTYREWQGLNDDIGAARELATEDASFAEEADRLEVSRDEVSEKLRNLLIPRDPNDGKDAIMEVKSGEGGEESALFAADPALTAKAVAVSARVYEFTEFLVTVLGITLEDRGGPTKVVLHTSCSARREMGVHLTGRALLGQLNQVSVAQQEHEAECCGFGGTFSVKHPEISGAMVQDKVNALRATGAERVVSADCGCLMNILGHAAWKDRQEGRTRPSLPGEHIATFLLKRTGGAQ